MIPYLYLSASLSQSSHRPALWDIDSSYLNGTFPFLRGLDSQPSRPSSHSVRGTSKHCQSACAAPSPPFSWLLVYLGSREWWWAPSWKTAEGIVDEKDVRGNVIEDVQVDHQAYVSGSVFSFICTSRLMTPLTVWPEFWADASSGIEAVLSVSLTDGSGFSLMRLQQTDRSVSVSGPTILHFCVKKRILSF